MYLTLSNIGSNEKGKSEKIFFNYRSYPGQHIDQWSRKTRKNTTALVNNKKQARVRIKRVKSDSYLTYANYVNHKVLRKYPSPTNTNKLIMTHAVNEKLHSVEQLS
jgi:hypothetical protein